MRKFTLAAGAVSLVLALSTRAEIDLKNFDLSVKPSDDFYLYANGTWQKNVVIPADLSRWGGFTELAERNWINVRAICERVAAKGAAGTAIERLVGDFYASGMDEAAINAAGATPLQAEFDRIAAIKTPADVMAAIAHLRLLGVASGFNFGGGPDAKNSDLTIAQLRQGGISLPSTAAGSAGGTDRDYYISADEKIVKIREQYVAHVTKLFELCGETPAAAKARSESAVARRVGCMMNSPEKAWE